MAIVQVVVEREQKVVGNQSIELLRSSLLVADVVVVAEKKRRAEKEREKKKEEEINRTVVAQGQIDIP